MSTFTTYCCRALLGAAGLLPLAARPAAAQGTFATASRQVPSFEYMTLTMVESAKREFAKLLLAPAFRTSSEVALDPYKSATETGNAWAFQSNQERLAKQLGELAADGWEVFEVHSAPYLPTSKAYSTRYLLRRPRH